MMYYELHLTIEDPAVDTDLPELKTDIENNGWKFSRIAGDPVLGKKTYCYATLHRAAKYDLETLKGKLASLASLLHRRGWEPIRQKVELVMFDSTNHTHEEQNDKEGRLVQGQ